MNTKPLILSSFLIFSFLNIFGQAPINDDPCNAILLSTNPFCSYSTFSNAGATASVGVPDPLCASYLGGDVWFKVVVPATGIKIDSNTGDILDGGMAIYSGTCSSLTLIECNDDDSPNGAMPQLYNTTLIPGDTIWIRFWEFANNNNGTFQICISETNIAADESCSAALLSVGTSCTYIDLSNVGSTGSIGLPAAGCGQYVDSDVWFKFIVPPATTNVIIDSNIGTITDGAMAIYYGTDCISLTLLECNDDDSPNGFMPLINNSSFIPGETIWIRFWKYNGGSGSFQMCVYAPEIISVPENQLIKENVIISPNPFSESATINFENPAIFGLNTEISIYNIMGEKAEVIISKTSTGFEIQKGNLSNGIYFFIITSNKKNISVGKLVVE